jgi:hypothetical protein
MQVSSMNIQSISEAEWNVHEQSLFPMYTHNYIVYPAYAFSLDASKLSPFFGSGSDLAGTPVQASWKTSSEELLSRATPSIEMKSRQVQDLYSCSVIFFS